jgi:hypothetical protein
LALSGIRLALPAFTILFALENNLSDGTEVELTDRYFLATMNLKYISANLLQIQKQLIITQKLTKTLALSPLPPPTLLLLKPM